MAKEKKEGNSLELNSNKWSRTRRIEFIDFRLSVDGKINRSDLVEFFGISIPQASLDLTYYRDLVKNCTPPRENLHYDLHKKIYVRTEDFIPVYPSECSPDAFFNDLELIAKNGLSSARNFFGSTISVDMSNIRPPKRNLDSAVLSNIVDAIQKHYALHVVYLSVSSGKYDDYLIAPHSFAFDGYRWHIRAYCYDKHQFRDYVVARIKTADVPKIPAPNDRFPDPIGNGFREVGTDCLSDRAWNETIVLHLKANPELPEGSRRAIELDYGVEPDETIYHTVRKALLYYAVRSLKATEDYKKLPAVERQLVLINEKEVFDCLKNS